jgi:hypothetical protein
MSVSEDDNSYTGIIGFIYKCSSFNYCTSSFWYSVGGDYWFK